MVRSPFASAEAARQKELEIAKFWGFEVVEITGAFEIELITDNIPAYHLTSTVL